MYQSIGMDEFYQKTKRESLAIIDVRETYEYEQGHIAGAKNLPLSTLGGQSLSLDKETDYYIICQSGGRSAQACAYLAEQEQLKVTNVLGGMSAWKGAMIYGEL